MVEQVYARRLSVQEEHRANLVVRDRQFPTYASIPFD